MAGTHPVNYPLLCVMPANTHQRSAQVGLPHLVKRLLPALGLGWGAVLLVVQPLNQSIRRKESDSDDAPVAPARPIQGTKGGCVGRYVQNSGG